LEKKRLDLIIFERGFTDSKERAKALVLSGSVYVNGVKSSKAGEKFSQDIDLRVEKPLRYVSRGGLKLEKALDFFQISPEDKICLDVGASTGGFTDCLLQKGASKVYSVDVGYGQIDWKLRNDQRVVLIERCNFRYISNELIKDEIDIAVVDVSFISLKLIIPKLIQFMKKGGNIVALIKPQFEVGKGEVGKGGIVRDEEKHSEVIKNLSNFFSDIGCKVIQVTDSPILGQKGNREFLIHLNI